MKEQNGDDVRVVEILIGTRLGEVISLKIYNAKMDLDIVKN
jgi:hypothetical protein